MINSLKKLINYLGDPASLDVHVLDMQPWKEGLLLLTAAVNTVRSPQMRYALGIGYFIDFIFIFLYFI